MNFAEWQRSRGITPWDREPRFSIARITTAARNFTQSFKSMQSAMERTATSLNRLSAEAGEPHGDRIVMVIPRPFVAGDPKEEA